MIQNLPIMLFGIPNFVPITVWHENFTVVKFYGSPLNSLDENLSEF